MNYPFEIFATSTRDLSLITSKQLVFNTGETTPKEIIYTTFYIPALQYIFVFSMLIFWTWIITLFINKKKK